MPRNGDGAQAPKGRRPAVEARMPKRGWDADAEARRLECGCRRRGGGGAGVRSAAVGAPAACRCGVLRARTPRGRGRRYGRLSVGWLAERQGAGPVGLQGGVERGKTASVRWRSRALSLLCCRFAPPIPLRLRAACEDFLASRGFVSLGRVVSRAFHQVRGRAWISRAADFRAAPFGLADVLLRLRGASGGGISCDRPSRAVS